LSLILIWILILNLNLKERNILQKLETILFKNKKIKIGKNKHHQNSKKSEIASFHKNWTYILKKKK